MKRSIVVAIVSVAGLGILVSGRYWWKHSRRYISTEDAVVSGRPHPITVRIPGTVSDVYIHDNEMVRAGEPLFRLDDRDYKTTLTADQATLSRAKKIVAVDRSNISESLADREKTRAIAIGYVDQTLDNPSLLLTFSDLYRIVGATTLLLLLFTYLFERTPLTHPPSRKSSIVSPKNPVRLLDNP